MSVTTSHLTAQQIFDTVVDHAATMPGQAVVGNSSEGCLYRTPDGNACFVGVLLTDDEAEGLDDLPGGTSVRDVIDQGQLPTRLIPHIELLEDLQGIHDFTGKKKVWAAHLRDLATQYGLNHARIDERFPTA